MLASGEDGYYLSWQCPLACILNQKKSLQRRHSGNEVGLRVQSKRLRICRGNTEKGGSSPRNVQGGVGRVFVGTPVALNDMLKS